MPQHIPAQFIGRIKVMTSLPVGSRLWNKKKKKSEFHILKFYFQIQENKSYMFIFKGRIVWQHIRQKQLDCSLAEYKISPEAPWILNFFSTYRITERKNIFFNLCYNKNNYSINPSLKVWQPNWAQNKYENELIQVKLSV